MILIHINRHNILEFNEVKSTRESSEKKILQLMEIDDRSDDQYGGSNVDT